MTMGSAAVVDPSKGLEAVRPAKDRMLSLDVIRAAAIAMVVLLHSSSPIMYQIGKVPARVWDIHNLVDSAVRVCVPLFFMLSGFLLLSSTSANDNKPFRDVGKRVSRILLPLILWSFAYRAYGTYMLGQPIDLAFALDTLGAMAQGALVYHLWFLYELLAIYLLLPLLRRLFKDGDKPAIYFFVLWALLPAGKLCASLMGWNFPLSNYLNFSGAGFFVAGHLLRRHLPSPSLRVVLIATAAYLAAFTATVFATSLASSRAGLYVETFHVYATPNVVVMSISAFVILLFLGNLLSLKVAPFGKRLVSSLATCSFGIYLVHVLILERFSYNVLGRTSQTITQATYAIAATALATIALAWALTWCMRLTRLTRWLVP